MFFSIGQRAGMNDKHFIVNGQREDNLQPSAAVSAAHGPEFPARRAPISAGPGHVFAFRDADAVFRGVVEIPFDPAEQVSPYAVKLYTHNLRGQRAWSRRTRRRDARQQRHVLEIVTS